MPLTAQPLPFIIDCVFLVSITSTVYDRFEIDPTAAVRTLQINIRNAIDDNLLKAHPHNCPLLLIIKRLGTGE